MTDRQKSSSEVVRNDEHRRPVNNKMRSQAEREIFARNLRRVRREAGFSQSELAFYTGVAQTHISEMENAMHNVCIDTMSKLALFLNVSVFQLLIP